MALNQFYPIYFTPPPVRGRYLSGLWKSSGSAPSSPDPVATANAQGTANIDAAKTTTALSHADQITPYGTLKWTQGGSGAGFDQTGYDSALKQYQTDLDAYNTKKATGTTNATTGADGSALTAYGKEQSLGAAPTEVDRTKFNTNYDPLKWTSSIELDPRVQSLVDAQLTQSQGLTGATNSALDRVNSTMATAAPTAAASKAYADGQFSSVANDIAGSQALTAKSQGLVGSQLDKLGKLYSTDLNYNSATALPGVDEAARQKIEDSLYTNSTARLDPQFQQAQSDLDARLATQGITQGSAAWQRENTNESMAKTDAYANARNTAVTNSTDQMQKLFQMGLASRQQGVSEANTIRNQTSQEAAQAAALNTSLGNENRGYLATETAQNLAKSNIAATDYSMESAQRNQVLNELNSLRSGEQVTMPTFQANTGGATAGAAPIAQTTAADYASQIAAYNAQLGSQNSLMGGLSTLGAAGIAAFA